MIDLDQIGSLAGEVSIGGASYSSNGRLATELFILETSKQIENRVYEQLRDREAATVTAEAASGATAVPQALTTGRVTVAPASNQVPNAIRVTATSPVPGDAAILANLYTDEYIRLAREANRTHLSATREFLEGQEEERLAELRDAEEAVKNYTMQNRTLGLDQETSLMISQIATLESQRDDARIDLQMRRSNLQATEDELEAINPMLVERFSSGVDRQMESAQTQLADLEREREMIMLRNPQLTDRDAAALEPIDQQIRSLQNTMERLSQQFVDEVMATGGISNSEGGLANVADLNRQVVRDRIEITGLQSRIEMMTERLAEYQRELGAVPELSLDLARLERSRMYAEEQYHSVLGRLQEAQLNEESQPGYAQVIREATLPREPVSPNVPRNIALGLVLGLFIGIGLAVTRDKVDNRIHKPDELRRQGVPVIGTVPNMQSLIKRDFGNKVFVHRQGHPISTSLISILDPMSSISEAYRAIRTSIQFSLPDKVVRTVLVTSPSLGEGKSTTAANLAAVMAHTDRKTLLIDADMRRPRQHSLFGKKAEPGLVQALFGEGEIDIEQLASGHENLYILPAGGMVSSGDDDGPIRGRMADGTSIPNPAELIGSARMREVIEKLKAQFDVIIIDTPPVLAATDAALLSTQCDATLVVCRAGVTKEGDLEFSLNVLADVGASVIGTVLNAFDISLAYGYKYRFGAYSNYAHYAGYGYGTGEKKKADKKRVKRPSRVS
jgi:Mrp family chromosome partitioning ATPase/uncharacterized protein involved in exopolysaccharide biosynthesis